ncbi:hypothetical protein GF319_15910 [Candidatus Bathyarchaeota archaeon]|nr:hypothetical protein [Candidatus Bathyarchaeota archaeon]
MKTVIILPGKSVLINGIVHVGRYEWETDDANAARLVALGSVEIKGAAVAPPPAPAPKPEPEASPATDEEPAEKPRPKFGKGKRAR